MSQISNKDMTRHFAGFIPESKRSDFYAFIKRVAKIDVLDPDVIEIVPDPPRGELAKVVVKVEGVPTCFTTTRLKEADTMELNGIVFPFQTLSDLWFNYALSQNRFRCATTFKTVGTQMGLTPEAITAAQKAYAPYGGDIQDSNNKRKTIDAILRRKQQGSAKRVKR